MKKFFLAALICAMSFGGVANAEGYVPTYEKYLDGDKNIQLVWNYKGDAEYAILDSLKIIHNGADYYEISIKYEHFFTGENGGGNGFSTRCFRQVKDGVSLPQYSEDLGKTWITIPSWKDKQSVEFDKNMHYPYFAFMYNPRAYQLFCVAYKKAFGKDYVDI